jgi:hypothetical protein
VRTSVSMMVSRIWMTASRRPPGVSISMMIAAAPASSATATTRSTYGASPRSIVPVMRITYTRTARRRRRPC